LSVPAVSLATVKPDKKFMAMFRFKTDLVPCTKLDPWFVTGFSDAESSFMINITKRPENKVG